METQRRILTLPRAMTCVVLLVSCAMALAQNDKYACTEPEPQSLCNAGNTCGSDSSPCEVDVKRDGNGASATPGNPARKATAPSA